MLLVLPRLSLPCSYFFGQLNLSFGVYALELGDFAVVLYLLVSSVVT